MLDKTRETYLLLFIFASFFSCIGVRLSLFIPNGLSGDGDDFASSLSVSSPYMYLQMHLINL